MGSRYNEIPEPVPPRRSRYLTAAFQPPHYGGASTFTYVLYGALRARGVDAQHLVVAREQHAPLFRNTFGDRWWNPDDLPDVHLFLRRTYEPADPELVSLAGAISPEVLVTKQYPVLAMLEGLSPDVSRWWLPSSCQAFATAWRNGEVETLTDGLGRLPEIFADGAPPDAVRTDDNGFAARESGLSERRHGVEAADRITCNSAHTADLFRACYPDHAAKVEARPDWFAAVVVDDVRRTGPPPQPFAERSVDLLFVASRWDRGEKNPELAMSLIDAYGEGSSVHVVGAVTPTPSFAVLHGLVSRQRTLELMADSRVVVVPSRLDSAPSVVFEAAALGCNVVASRNCGNWEACPRELLVDDYGVEGFAARIDRALARPYESRLAELVDKWPSERLATPLAELARADAGVG